MVNAYTVGPFIHIHSYNYDVDKEFSYPTKVDKVVSRIYHCFLPINIHVLQYYSSQNQVG